MSNLDNKRVSDIGRYTYWSKFQEVPDFYWEEIVAWIRGFCQKYPDFTTDKLWCCDDLSHLDKVFMEDLFLFYDKINDYAFHNYIKPQRLSFGQSYFVDFENGCYEIGRFWQGDVCFCKKINEDVSDRASFIDFEQMLSGKKTQYAQLVDNKLDILSNMIQSLANDGISVDILRNVCCHSLDDVMVESNGYSKKRKK